MKSALCEEDPFNLFKLDREMTLQSDGHVVGTIDASLSLQCDTSDAQIPTPDITMRATPDEASKAADIDVMGSRNCAVAGRPFEVTQSGTRSQSSSWPTRVYK